MSDGDGDRRPAVRPGLRGADGWLGACEADALLGGCVVTVPLPDADDGTPQTALLLRDQRGQPRAYLNRCRHLPIPLDAGSGRFLSADRRHLVCLTHGAEYRVADGLCERGPCQGSTLISLPLATRAGRLFVKCP